MFKFIKKYAVLTVVIVIAAVFTGYMLYNNSHNIPKGNKEAQSQKNSSSTSDKSSSQKSTNDNKESQSAASDTHNKDLIDEIVSLAKEGKVVNCDFVTGKTTIDDVEKVYGNPDKQDYISSAKGIYTTFSSKGLVFGFNKGMQIFETRSFDPRLQVISRSDIENVLGKAPYVAAISGTETQTVLGYTMNSDYKLEFVISNNTNHVDHVNILYPRATANLMADDPGRQW
ncbi:YjgB family protein [Thermoanaerobacterium thermosaccharolyticum]|uniref:YjgB family protein n=1 Tax=Thermoanaerobacterium thermosaccharolyticum TaxID=1517 RepID=UPI003DAA26CF